MLENKLHDIPYIILLRSDRILKDLLEDKAGNSHALNDAIQDFYPNKFRKESLVQAYHPKCKSSSQLNSLDYNFDCLDTLYNDYFTQNDSTIYAKKEKLDRYSSIINKIHPFNIVGYKLAKKLKNKQIDLDEINNIASEISPLGLDIDVQKRYSDNHIHLFGVLEPIRSIWHTFTESKTSKLENYRFDRDFRITQFSYINNRNINFEMLQDIGIIIMGVIYKFMIGDKGEFSQSTRKKICEVLFNPSYIREKETIFTFLKQIDIRHILNDSNLHKLFLLLLEKHNENKYIEAWFLYNVFLHYFHENTDNREIKAFIKIFFHISNILRSYQVMGENIGLGSFVEYFDSSNSISSSEMKNTKWKTLIEDFLKSNSSSSEIKLSPNYLNKINDITKGLGEYKHHFSIHINRLNDKNINDSNALSLDCRFLEFRKNLKKNNTDGFAKAIINKLRPSNKREEKLPIKSIDVAGNENLTPPEVFAPILKTLRNNELLLKLSIHAGEDFNHIVTGMRKIDETILFYEMTSKDRLGHALAVGLDPKEWLESNGDIIMSKEELLDNFVWLKRKIDEIPTTCIKIINLSKQYDTYIKELSSELYQNEFTSLELYKAWKLRENDPELFFEKDIPLIPVDGYPKYNLTIDNKIHSIYNRYHYDKLVRKNGAEIVYVQYEHFSKNHSYLKVTDEDLELYRVVQDYMLNAIASKNIFIEACPTSNIYISHLSKYEDHPIFRWHPIDKDVKKDSQFRHGIVKVCVNTDDPAIMPTNLPTEFEHLRLAGRKLDYDNNAVDRWLEELREFGNEIFDDNHEDIEV